MSASDTTHPPPFPRAPEPPRNPDDTSLRAWLEDSQGGVQDRLAAANYYMHPGRALGPAMAAEPHATAASKGTPTLLSPRAMSVANSADVRSQCSSDAPSLARSGTTNSSGCSVSTSLASAVSGMPLGDPEEGHVIARSRAKLECPFHFLNCESTFEDIIEWKAHSKTHWDGQKPPKRLTCPLCKFKAVCRDGDEAWDIRMNHVAYHHSMGYSLAASRPDFDLYEYMKKKGLLTLGEYKDLVEIGSKAPRESVSTTTHDSRRESQ